MDLAQRTDDEDEAFLALASARMHLSACMARREPLPLAGAGTLYIDAMLRLAVAGQRVGSMAITVLELLSTPCAAIEANSVRQRLLGCVWDALEGVSNEAMAEATALARLCKHLVRLGESDEVDAGGVRALGLLDSRTRGRDTISRDEADFVSQLLRVMAVVSWRGGLRRTAGAGDRLFDVLERAVLPPLLRTTDAHAVTLVASALWKLLLDLVENSYSEGVELALLRATPFARASIIVLAQCAPAGPLELSDAARVHVMLYLRSVVQNIAQAEFGSLFEGVEVDSPEYERRMLLVGDVERMMGEQGGALTVTSAVVRIHLPPSIFDADDAEWDDHIDDIVADAVGGAPRIDSTRAGEMLLEALAGPYPDAVCTAVLEAADAIDTSARAQTGLFRAVAALADTLLSSSRLSPRLLASMAMREVRAKGCSADVPHARALACAVCAALGAAAYCLQAEADVASGVHGMLAALAAEAECPAVRVYAAMASHALLSEDNFKPSYIPESAVPQLVLGLCRTLQDVRSTEVVRALLAALKAVAYFLGANAALYVAGMAEALQAVWTAADANPVLRSAVLRGVCSILVSCHEKLPAVLQLAAPFVSAALADVDPSPGAQVLIPEALRLLEAVLTYAPRDHADSRALAEAALNVLPSLRFLWWDDGEPDLTAVTRLLVVARAAALVAAGDTPDALPMAAEMALPLTTAGDMAILLRMPLDESDDVVRLLAAKSAALRLLDVALANRVTISPAHVLGAVRAALDALGSGRLGRSTCAILAVALIGRLYVGESIDAVRQVFAALPTAVDTLMAACEEVAEHMAGRSLSYFTVRSDSHVEVYTAKLLAAFGILVVVDAAAQLSPVACNNAVSHVHSFLPALLSVSLAAKPSEGSVAAQYAALAFNRDRLIAQLPDLLRTISGRADSALSDIDQGGLNIDALVDEINKVTM